ncbi:hypothetical protein EE612_008009, partial [Oryza sativa]
THQVSCNGQADPRHLRRRVHGARRHLPRRRPGHAPGRLRRRFFFDGLMKAGNTGNAVGSVVTAASVESLPGLNTMGVSMARIDYAPWGLNPPHTHPRATEIIFVVEGSLDVGFVTTANKLFTRTVCKGEVFVFPRGLVHFQKNNGNTPAFAIAALNSQLPGTQSIAAALFGAAPPLPSDTLARAFQVDGGMVEFIKSKFVPPKY